MAASADLWQQPADFFIQATGQLLDGALKAPLDAAEVMWRDYLPDSFVNLLDEFVKTSASVHAAQLPLMNPYDVLTIVSTYLSIVIVGRMIMPFLPKFELKPLVLLHNLFLVLLSSYMVSEVLHQAYVAAYSFWGNPSDESAAGWPMAKIIWVFYASKIVEFNDTFIMLLKHNFRQVSFLHVYHHVTIFAIWWLVTYTAPGGEAYYSAALNSFIHVVMYAYYLLSALGIKQVSFIKYYITKMQMLQFITMLVQSAYDIYTGGGGYPQLTTRILGVYMITLLILFANFLRQDQKRVKTLPAKQGSASHDAKSKRH